MTEPRTAWSSTRSRYKASRSRAKRKRRSRSTRKDGAFSAAAGEITAEDVKLSFPGFLRQDLTLSKFSLKADYDQARRRLAFERASIDAAAIAAEASGAVTFADGAAPALTLSGTLQPITVSDLLQHWPIGVGVGAEEWIRSQVDGGMVGPVGSKRISRPARWTRTSFPRTRCS